MQPMLHPGTGQPVGPDDLAPLFPMELILQEVSEEPEIAIPDEVLDIYRLWRPTPLYRALAARAGGRHALADLLQVRGHQPGRQPQAEHRGRAGLLQQAGGPHPALDRDRRRPVGQRARVRLQAASGSSARSTWCASRTSRSRRGARMIQTWGADGRAEPVAGHERRARDPRRAARLDRQPRDRDLGGGRGRRGPRGHRLLARQRAQPRAAPPDGDRPGGDRADGARRRVPGRRRRLRRRRLELRRARVPVPAREDRRPRDRLPRLRARRLPDADARPLRLRLRRHRAS